MIENRQKLPLRLLAVLALAAAACSVSASGQIPCVDDSSCPADYPVCTAGKCVEGTSSSAAASVSIVGVQGKAPTDEIRATVVVAVTAHADSGVKSVSLAGGGQTYAPDASSANGSYTFTVDTTKLTDGDVALTATVTPGDTTVAAKASTPFTVHVDNTPPTLSSPTLAAADVAPGASVALDVTASETLSSLSGTLTLGATTIALADTGTTGNVHHLIARLPANAAAGTYTIAVTATDLAGNSGSLSGAPSVTVHAPFTLAAANLTLSTAAGVTLGSPAVPAVTTGNALNISLTLPAGVVLASGAKPVITSAPSGGAATALTVSGTGPFTAAYVVAGTETDGSYVITATVTDIAGNVASFSKGFIIAKTAPTLPGGIVLATPIAGPSLPVSFSFSLSQTVPTLIVSVNGHTLVTGTACSGAATTHVSCSYTPSDAADFTPAGSLIITSVPITVTAKDALGNGAPVTITTLTLDHSPPTLTIANDLTGGINATGGTLLTIDVTPSKSLSAFSAVVVSGSTCAGSSTNTSFTDVAPATGSTRHLGYAVTGATGAGDYTLCLSATDLANNVIAAPVARTFHVFGSFTFGAGALVLSSPGSTTDGQGFPLVSAQTGHLTLSGTLALPISGAQLGSHQPVFTLSAPAGSSSPTTQTGTNGQNMTYAVGGGDGAGLVTVTARLTDVAGNSATTAATFDIKLSAPSVSNVVIAPQPDSFNKGFLLTFSTGEVVPSATLVVASVQGTPNHPLTCAGSTSWSCGGGSSSTVYTPVSGDTNTINLSVSDIVGNTNASSPTYTLDTTLPNFASPAPVLSAVSGVTPGSIETLCVCPSKTLASLTGVVKDGTNTSIGSATLVPLAPACVALASCSTGGGWQELSFVVPSTTASGSYTFNATGTDLANNVGTAAPAFTVNGTFANPISGLTVSQNPTSLNGAPTFMGAASGQYACSVDWGASTAKTGQVKIQFTVPASVTLKPGSEFVATLVDSAANSFALLGSTSVRTGNTVTMKTCIPSLVAGSASNAADGIATISVVATSNTNNVSNTLNTTVFIKSNAPQASGVPSTGTPLVGPAQTSLSFTFGVTEIPSVAPVATLTFPSGSTPTTSCARVGTTFNFACGTYTLVGGDQVAATAAPVGISVAMQDAVGNTSTTGSGIGAPFHNLINYKSTPPNPTALSITSPTSNVVSNVGSVTYVVTSGETLGSVGAGTQFQLIDASSNVNAAVPTVSLPCGFTSPCVVSFTGIANLSAHTGAVYHLQVKSEDLIGNINATFKDLVTPTFTLDQNQPSLLIDASGHSFTVTDQQTGQSCVSTTNVGACDNVVFAKTGDNLVFSGFVTLAPVTGEPAKSLSSATATSAGVSSGGSSCSVSGITFTCTIPVTSGSSTTGNTSTFTFSDNLANSSGSVTGPKLALDNSVPAAETITAGSGGFITTGTTPGASVPTVSNNTHNWTINGGTITTTLPADSITFTISAGVGGTVTLNCTETNRSGTSTACTPKILTVAAAPATPTITTIVNGVPATSVVASSTGNQAAVTAHANMTYNWTVNAATALITGGQGTATLTYTAPPSGNAVLSVTEQNQASVQSSAGTKTMTTVGAGVNTPTITVPATVTAGTSNGATVVNHAGETYAWTTSSNGTITGGQGTNSLTFAAGVAGTDITLNVTATQTSTGLQASATPAVAHVAAVPTTPAIVLSAGSVTTGATGLTAQVTANANMTYCWTVVNATITAGGSGTGGGGVGCTNGQGVIATGHDTITYTAGSAGTPVTLNAQEVNAAGLSSSPNQVTQPVFADVATPSITAAANVAASGTGNVASITTPHSGMSYNWQVFGGTALITAGQGTSTITYTAPTSGQVPSGSTFAISATEQNGAGKISSAGNATVTNLTAPGTPTASALPATIGNKETRTATITSSTSGLTFNWTLTGADITAGQGTSTVTYVVTAQPGGTVTASATATNAAGTVSIASIPTSQTVAAGSFSNIADLAAARVGATVTQLSDGRILITGGAPTAGGTPVNTAVICSTLGEACALTSNNMHDPRMNHTATLLASGKVLVAGGFTAAGPASPIDSADVLDPAGGGGLGAFSRVNGGGTMNAHRAAHVAVLLNDGLVLAAGGTSDGSTALNSAEIYDPAQGAQGTFVTFNTATLKEARMNFAAAQIAPTKILLIGSGTSGKGEVFDEVNNSSTANVQSNATFLLTTGLLSAVTTNLTATLLNNFTQVLIAGGHASGAPTSVSYLFTIAGTGIATTGSLATPRELHTATQLFDGRVLIAGGTTTGAALTATSEVYGASGVAASVTGSMTNARSQHAATLTKGGEVLMVGGLASGTAGSMEIYQP